MEFETEQIVDKLKPLMPIWISIPLYFVVSLIFIFVSSLVDFPLNSLISSEWAYGELIKATIRVFFQAASVAFSAFIFLKYVHRVSPGELGLSIKGRGKDCLWGFLLAVILYATGFSVSLLWGVISVVNVHFDPILLLLNLLFYFFAASFEEIILRGYVQGRLMTKMNKFQALCITSVLFSMIHLGNQNIGILPVINLFLAGIMLGASFLYTRNLVFPIVLHLFWNWIQGPVLGYEVSGIRNSPSLLTLSLPGNNIINGGAFGFEGSIICTVLLVVASVLIIHKYRNYEIRH